MTLSSALRRTLAILPALAAVCILPAAVAQEARVALHTASAVVAQGTAGVDLGTVPASQPLSRIVLTLHKSQARQADLDTFLHDVQDRTSPLFRHWLLPATFAARFAPAAAPELTDWLQAQGLQLTSTTPGGSRIIVSGTAEQASRAFAISLHRMAQPSGESIGVVGDPTAPAAVAALVDSISGLDGTSPLATLQAAVAGNEQSVLVADLSASSAPAEELAAALEQAAAQGQTVILATPASTPARAVVLAGTATTPGDVPRPSWQAAPGLPSDTLRAVPDAAADATALTAALGRIVTRAGARQGEVAAVFYRLAAAEGVFRHADASIPAGTWAAADGLGSVDLDKLVEAWPLGATSPLSATISLSSRNINHGASIVLTATVTGGSGSPTGTVTFGSAQSGTLGSAPLSSSGVATYTASGLAGGQYGFFGTYSGDATYSTATTNVDTATVQPESAAVGGSANSATVGGTITATVTVTSPSGVGTPSGTVTVFPYGTTISAQKFTGTLAPTSTVGTASAAVSIPATDAGSFDFQANCTTDASFSCYIPSTIAVTVAKATPTVALLQSGSATSATLTATVKPPAGSNSSTTSPGGKVNFLDGTTVIGSASLNTSGVAIYTGPLGTGTTHSVSAVYLGDGNFVTANSNAAPVTKVTPGVTLTAASSGGTLTAAVTPPSGSSTVATGSVQFLDGTTVLGTSALDGTGRATYVGAYTPSSSVKAVYSGDTLYNSATSNALGVSKATPSIVLTQTSTGNTAPFTFSVTVRTLGANISATGPVQFLDGTTPLATVALAGGTATYTGSLAAGTAHSITASYAGDSIYDSGVSNAVAVTSAVTLIPTTTSLTSASGYSGPFGMAFMLNVIVKPSSYIAAGTGPTGTVTISDPTQGVVGTGVLDATGNAAISVSTLNVGARSLTAMYSGDGNYAASASTVPTVITITPVTATLAATITPSGSIPYGYNANLNITATASAGTTGPTGTVTATVSGNNGVYTGTLSPTTGSLVSTASISFPVPPPGTYTIAITCGANITCTAATVRITTTKGSTVTTLTAITPSTPQAGVPATVSATVTNAGTGTAMYTFSGTISFYSNNTFLGSAPVSNGTATRSVTFLNTTAQSVTAVYSGDTNWNGSTSQPLSVTPTPLPAVINLGASTVNGIAGQNITLTANVSSGQTASSLLPTGTVTFYDTFNGIVVNLGTAPLISNTLNASSAQISTTGLRAGRHDISAVYTGDNVFLKTTSATTTVNIGDFTLSFLPPQLTLRQGSSGTLTVAVAGINGFSGQVALGCTPPPDSKTTCVVSPSVAGTGTTAVLYIGTTATVTQKAAVSTVPRTTLAAGAAGLAALFLLRRRRRIVCLLGAVIAIAAATGGCADPAVTTVSTGTGTTNTGTTTTVEGTPYGTLNFTVVAASVDSPVNARHTYVFQVNVQ